MNESQEELEQKIRKVIDDHKREEHRKNVKATADFICETPVVREVATVVVDVLDIFGF